MDVAKPVKRQSRDLMPGVEETIIIPPEVVEPRFQSLRPNRPRPRPNLHRPLPGGPTSPLQHLLGCNSFSCMNHCPPACDSLCTANLQCFCSCPEDDLSYDYYDYGPGPGMFGGGPGPAYY